MARRRTGSAPEAHDEQTRLPLGTPDEPIDYVLTARARRIVAPETLPDLEVVPGETRLPADTRPDLHDARPARARALRRAGIDVAEIAARLEVDEDLVRGWCRQVVPTRRRRDETQRRTSPPTAIRVRARKEAAEALAGTGDAAVAGALAGLATVTSTSVSVTTDDAGLAAGIVRWLRERAGASAERVRVHLEAADGVSRDLVARDWAERLDLPLEQISHARWHDAPELGAVRCTIRCGEPAVAAVVAGWRDALSARATP